MSCWRLEVHEALTSTSDNCVGRARQGESTGLAVQALRQTAAQASRGRAWETLDGNLALSVLIRPAGPAMRSGEWAVAGAVAFRNGLARFADDVTIKWPNDVLRNGRKVGGLLINAETSGPSLSWVVLGFGANLRSAPPGSAAALGPHDPQAVAAAVLDQLTAVLRIWRADGFEPIRQLWLRHAHPPGTPLRVRAANLDVSGAFAGLGPGCALLLATRDGVRAFSTGEVLLGC